MADTKNPAVSIVLPVYQVESYLCDCLDSICCQTFTNWELICVYDESSDRSLGILEEYQAVCPNIRILTGRGKGLSGARNDGLAVARGKYVLFMDSDDLYPQAAIESGYGYMEQGEADILVFSAWTIPTQPQAPMFYSNYLTTRNVTYEPFRPEALFKELGARPFVWRNCYRREFLMENMLWFDEELRLGEDQAFQMVAFPCAKKICFRREKMYIYRWLRAGSLFYNSNLDPETKIQGHIEVIKHTLREWKCRGFYEGMKEEFSEWARDIVFSELNNYPQKTADRLFLQIREWMPNEVDLPQRNRHVPECGASRYLIKLTHCIRMHGVIRTMTLVTELIKLRLFPQKAESNPASDKD